MLIFLYFQWPRTVKAYQTVNITLHSSTVCNITERKGNRYSSMTQKAYPHRIMSIDQQKISQNHEIVFLHYLVKFLIWRPFSPINKLPINTQVKATVATNQNSSFNNPRTVIARWLHMHASMGPVLKSYKLTKKKPWKSLTIYWQVSINVITHFNDSDGINEKYHKNHKCYCFEIKRTFKL